MEILSTILVATAVCSITTVIIYRIRAITTNQLSINSCEKSKKCHLHLVGILGSGGHSSEMVSLLRDIDPARYTHRSYIASSGDSFAYSKALEIETYIQSKFRPSGPTTPQTWDPLTGIWDLRIVPRARKIHQPLVTTMFSSLLCAIGCLKELRSIKKASRATSSGYPDVIISNGPATAVIFILVAALMRVSGMSPLRKMKTIYVESWARVDSLSLSGRFLLSLGICDRFLVQWESLARKINKKGKKVQWAGFLVE
ncbi:BgTH12-07974 [Blumeria graminis f. sp. triticale]|uniref:UDP-N-acetylglucosamine transferase subunit ALG14 n=4 Tax=Blumeria graminis TaxID=34373 RepID=A0A656KFJ8_BLUGR|nr:Oligosaccharide biosynthesis protein [Blumeria graminis f. sp. tritici 96224]CAD6505079.1 BgTH12-07974 [Blumeria graminis f. sp. triticale]VDB93082.1 Bgt-1148 [Blumeria graminis f. sp. tritici]